MESGPTHSVRVVRCPRCRMLLPEPPNIPVYKCGGCGTVLQVKNRKKNANGTTSVSHETETAQMNESNHVSEVGESGSSKQKAILPSSAECCSDQNQGGDQKMFRYHVFEVGECSNSSQQENLPSSAGHSLDQNGEGDQKKSRDHISEDGEACSSSQKQILHSSGECSLDQNSGGDQKISTDHVSEDGESSSSSQNSILPSSGECSLDQNSGGDQKISTDHVSKDGESSSSSQNAILPSSGECSWDQNYGGDQKISRDRVSESGESSSSSQKAILPSSGECSLDKQLCRDCSVANSEELNSSDKDQNNKSDHYESQDCNIKQPGVSIKVCSSFEDANHENEDLSQLARANSEVELNEMSSPHAGAKLAEDVNSQSNTTVRSSTTDNMAGKENNSTVTSHKLAAESFSSDVLLSSPDEQPKQRQMNVNLSYERRDFFSPQSDVSSKAEYYKAKSPRFRNSYEYDGSVSSYDGTDDQVPHQHVNLHENTFQVANSVTSEERCRRDKLILGNSIMNGNSKMQHPRNHSSASPDTRPYITDYRKWSGDELLGSTGHGLPVSNVTRLQDDEFASPLPFYQRRFPAGYESVSTSSPLQDESHHSPGEQEKIKLLKMVYELQDRINKTCHVNEKANRRVSAGITSMEKYNPAQYSSEIPEDEFLHDYYRRAERRMPVSNWPHQHKLPHIPFSGEATANRQHMRCSYMHCYPQDLQCSVPLPPPFLSHNKGLRSFPVHSGASCYNSYGPCPSSPQQFADSKFPLWHCETKSDYQRHEDHCLKEKHFVAKRHLRPTAGGAPFITCYSCLYPLQLPADFLVFKRRFHLLRCGACSKVLKFSLKRRTHIVPYTPEAATPSPSQLVDYNDAINRRNSVSSSRGNGCSPADPVSCSDDYGLSHCKSCSTDGDPVIIAPFRNGQGITGGRNFSYDSSESMKERPQFVRKQPGNKNKNPVEAQASPEPSSNKSRPGKISSEIEELPAKGSPLHQLMGYSSPSQVLKGSGPSSSGTSSHYI
ncbi:hypothetical protein WN944_018193 [Citrus x changshan-huyou]|uniref:Zinc-ribbon domain-containing protein n=1 Tax=Citrus x changshan-huyou TaxID=2935761 RepID=A0AAP0LXL2_9ROSI